MKTLLLIALLDGRVFYNVMENEEACHNLALALRAKHSTTRHYECLPVKHVIFLGKKP